MPDITMCSGELCTLKETCHRFKALPNSEWQSYFQVPPNTNFDKCEYYWPDERILKRMPQKGDKVRNEDNT